MYFKSGSPEKKPLYIHDNEHAGLVFGGFDEARGRVANSVFSENRLENNDSKKTWQGELVINWAYDNLVYYNIFAPNSQNINLYSALGNVNNSMNHNLYCNSNVESSSWVWRTSGHYGLEDFQTTGQGEGSQGLNNDCLNIKFQIDSTEENDQDVDPEPDYDNDEKNLLIIKGLNDTYVKGGKYAEYNYCEKSILKVRNHYDESEIEEILIKFPFGSNININQKLIEKTDIILRMYVKSVTLFQIADDCEVGVYLINQDQNWIDTDVIYNDAPQHDENFLTKLIVNQDEHQKQWVEFNITSLHEKLSTPLSEISELGFKIKEAGNNLNSRYTQRVIFDSNEKQDTAPQLFFQIRDEALEEYCLETKDINYCEIEEKEKNTDEIEIDTDTDTQVIKCEIKHCIKCSSDQKCSIAQVGYVVNSEDGLLQECDDSCQDGCKNSPKECNKCSIGYELINDKCQKINCINSNCEECFQSSYICDKCLNTKDTYLKNGKCYDCFWYKESCVESCPKKISVAKGKKCVDIDGYGPLQIALLAVLGVLFVGVVLMILAKGLLFRQKINRINQQEMLQNNQQQESKQIIKLNEQN